MQTAVLPPGLRESLALQPPPESGRLCGMLGGWTERLHWGLQFRSLDRGEELAAWLTVSTGKGSVLVMPGEPEAAYLLGQGGHPSPLFSPPLSGSQMSPVVFKLKKKKVLETLS